MDCPGLALRAIPERRRSFSSPCQCVRQPSTRFDAKLQRLLAAVVRGEWGGMRTVARQAAQGFLLRLRPYSRPVSIAPRQGQNHDKHNPIKYDAARLCLLSHQHRVHPSDFNLLGERLREATGSGWPPVRRPIMLSCGIATPFDRPLRPSRRRLPWQRADTALDQH